MPTLDIDPNNYILMDPENYLFREIINTITRYLRAISVLIFHKVILNYVFDKVNLTKKATYLCVTVHFIFSNVLG